ncbi:hypothetical protein ACH5RR_002940 [Cinchona calisaya]|uniref:Uncharacterized protein n=1 Tax=Cinchona calisaya TaxID=153742 RepID=A0ABD3ATE6_9GENT
MSWRHSPDGTISVKCIYDVLRKEQYPIMGPHLSWKVIWNSNFPPRDIQFLQMSAPFVIRNKKMKIIFCIKENLPVEHSRRNLVEDYRDLYKIINQHILWKEKGMEQQIF